MSEPEIIRLRSIISAAEEALLRGDIEQAKRTLSEAKPAVYLTVSKDHTGWFACRIENDFIVERREPHGTIEHAEEQARIIAQTAKLPYFPHGTILKPLVEL